MHTLKLRHLTSRYRHSLLGASRLETCHSARAPSCSALRCCVEKCHRRFYKRAGGRGRLNGIQQRCVPGLAGDLQARTRCGELPHADEVVPLHGGDERGLASRVRDVGVTPRRSQCVRARARACGPRRHAHPPRQTERDADFSAERTPRPATGTPPTPHPSTLQAHAQCAERERAQATSGRGAAQGRSPSRPNRC